jgi:hypothetical protein
MSEPNFGDIPRKHVTRLFLGKTYKATVFNRGQGWIVTDLTVTDAEGKTVEPKNQAEHHLFAEVVVEGIMSSLTEGTIPDVTVTDARPIEEEAIELQLAYAAQLLPGGREQLMHLMSRTIIDGGLGPELLKVIQAANDETKNNLVDTLLETLKERIKSVVESREKSEPDDCPCPNCSARRAAEKARKNAAPN